MFEQEEAFEGDQHRPSCIDMEAESQTDETTWFKVSLGESGKIIIINSKPRPMQSGIQGSISLVQNFTADTRISDHSLPLLPSH